MAGHLLPGVASFQSVVTIRLQLSVPEDQTFFKNAVDIAFFLHCMEGKNRLCLN